MQVYRKWSGKMHRTERATFTPEQIESFNNLFPKEDNMSTVYKAVKPRRVPGQTHEILGIRYSLPLFEALQEASIREPLVKVFEVKTGRTKAKYHRID
jgi:hypothetical protein